VWLAIRPPIGRAATGRICPNCGRPIPMDANLCPYCGKNFQP
jgi:RNA polymerase subunit RPABC4/transcription elongation factor Spt4